MNVPMKICWFGIYNKKYPRNDILFKGLEMNRARIVECCEDAYDNRRYRKLLKKLKSLRGEFDIIFCPYPATIPTILAKIFTNKTVVMDAFYSMYDAVVNDRKEMSWYHPRAIKLIFLDWLSVFLADIVITDTKHHKDYWSEWLFINSNKIFPVYLGVDDSVYHPLIDNADVYTEGNKNINRPFIISFHGTFIPLQGVQKIAEAAKILLNNENIRFRLIGSGGEYSKILEYIKKNNLHNVEIIERVFGGVSTNILNKYLNEADIILGIFGDTEKAKRVIPNKVYEGMALRKPVITMDSGAVREVFTDRELYLIHNDPESIADAILKLTSDRNLMLTYSKNAYSKIIDDFTPRIISKLFLEILSIRT